MPFEQGLFVIREDGTLKILTVNQYDKSMPSGVFFDEEDVKEWEFCGYTEDSILARIWNRLYGYNLYEIPDQCIM